MFGWLIWIQWWSRSNVCLAQDSVKVLFPPRSKFWGHFKQRLHYYICLLVFFMLWNIFNILEKGCAFLIVLGTFQVETPLLHVCMSWFICIYCIISESFFNETFSISWQEVFSISYQSHLMKWESDGFILMKWEIYFMKRGMSHLIDRKSVV